MSNNLKQLRNLLNDFYSTEHDYQYQICQILKQGITLPVYYNSEKISHLFYIITNEYFMFNNIKNFKNNEYHVSLFSLKKRLIKSTTIKIGTNGKYSSKSLQKNQLKYHMKITQLNESEAIDCEKLFNNYYEPKIKQLLANSFNMLSSISTVDNKESLVTKHKLKLKYIKILENLGFFIKNKNYLPIDYILEKTPILLQNKDLLFWEELLQVLYKTNSELKSFKKIEDLLNLVFFQGFDTLLANVEENKTIKMKQYERIIKELKEYQ